MVFPLQSLVRLISATMKAALSLDSNLQVGVLRYEITLCDRDTVLT